MRKDRKVNISKRILFYFYFEPIAGLEVRSGSICRTGECGPELAILTAWTTLSFGLGIRDRFPECLFLSWSNLASHRSSFIDTISFEAQASASALWSLLTSSFNFRFSSIKAAFVSKSDNSPVFSSPPFLFLRFVWGAGVEFLPTSGTITDSSCTGSSGVTISWCICLLYSHNATSGLFSNNPHLLQPPIIVLELYASFLILI